MNGLQIIALIILSIGIMVILWSVAAFLFGTIRKDGTAEVSLVIRGVTDPQQLEHVVRSLMWQRSRIGLASMIIIVDDGLSEEARQMAEIYAEENEFIQIASKHDL